MASNPFEAPDGDVAAQEALDADFAVEVASRMRAVWGWYMVIGLIFAGLAALMMLMGLVMLIFPTFLEEVDEVGIGAALSLVYFIGGAIYGLPGGLLIWAGVQSLRIDKSDAPDRAQILSALNARNWFWHVSGGGCLLLFVVYFAIFVGAIVMGIAGAAAL